MDKFSHDSIMRAEAFEHVRRLQVNRDQLLSADLAAGFVFNGKRYPLINPQRGIFKPRQMEHLLSIKTVYPRKGARIWYDDQREVHRQLFEGDESINYSFMGENPESADNRWLRSAYENQIPIIYFIGISPGHYQAILPAFIVGWDPRNLSARVAFGVTTEANERYPDSAPERRYALREVQQRIHQVSFRDAVIAAYGGRCAFSGLPEPRLLDAAHIIEDRHLEMGQPVVVNGIPLSKIHHAAFDAQMIGIDPDYRIHLSRNLLDMKDGPMLDALKSVNGSLMRLPHRVQDRPDRDRLALRYEKFRELA